MERKILEKLIEWKERNHRKPLIINGARQVGKIWILKKFGDLYYKKTVYINFESNSMMDTLFASDINPDQLIRGLEIYYGEKINVNEDLIIFDEIQENSRALTALKYFNENASDIHIVAAGSLLGVSMNKRVSFPVGKVEFLNMYPMDFEEYLMATQNEMLLDLIRSHDTEMINATREKFIEQLRCYYFVGGMPEVVKEYSLNGDFGNVRKIQIELLTSYERDFSKHAPSAIISRLRMLWHSIPSQLAKENKKFVYGQVKSGARAKDYELALSWLVDCGLIYKVNRVKKPSIPLVAYEDTSAFKLFVLDVGLLCALYEIDVKILLEGHKLFTEFKGSMSEQYVLQQLAVSKDNKIHYWSSDKGAAEIDFLIMHNGLPLPIEVKAEENLKAKSLKVFAEKYQIDKSLRISMSNYRDEGWIKNIPLFAIGLIGE